MTRKSEDFAQACASGTGKIAELREDLLKHVACGGAVLTWCAIAGHPCRTTVYKWTREDPDFGAQFARAREDGADSLVEESQQIADDATPLDVQVAKLRTEQRWKRAACYCPRIYGQKAQVEHQGGVTIQVVTGVPDTTGTASD